MAGREILYRFNEIAENKIVKQVEITNNKRGTFWKIDCEGLTEHYVLSFSYNPTDGWIAEFTPTKDSLDKTAFGGPCIITVEVKK
ncbi:MAG: hypothetical protein WCV41_02970 [Patescibacteria group bacterium]